MLVQKPVPVGSAEAADLVVMAAAWLLVIQMATRMGTARSVSVMLVTAALAEVATGMGWAAMPVRPGEGRRRCQQ